MDGKSGNWDAKNRYQGWTENLETGDGKNAIRDVLKGRKLGCKKPLSGMDGKSGNWDGNKPLSGMDERIGRQEMAKDHETGTDEAEQQLAGL